MSDNQGITPKHLRNLGNLPIDNGTETPDSDIQNKSMHQNDIAPHISEVDQFLDTLKIHNKDLDACFNDALAVKHLLELHTQAVLDELEARLAKLPERGFAIPKVGTPDHAKGTFTKLVSEQEAREVINTMKGE